ncbi:hypothetical protein ACFQ3P_02850 [Paraburkholderia sabiae]|uniref:Uncharacterized protein n=1 Tax=Paraburkholderia sabiae TaxID=273251 RepID=A0ABU9Q719_9BURK|nr:hypothetical protein [Paraburkholderia sabiae]WJZ78807.1 hypothetical protein QEN71_33060 [Paraburkholderia sabiae]CAD6512457.1 hypothetical protein LMG24235_00571 [Paraburkholderia sabiae]
MEKSAFDLGLIAAENGSDEAINPFPVSSAEWRDWYDGFRCVCHADVQARRDLKRFYLTPPVAVFTCALAALIDIVFMNERLGLAGLFPQDLMPWCCAISAVLIASTIALAARLRVWIDVFYIAAMLAPIPVVPWFDASAIRHEWFRYVIACAFILAPLIACLMLAGDVKGRYRASATKAARQARTFRHDLQRQGFE